MQHDFDDYVAPKHYKYETYKRVFQYPNQVCNKNSLFIFLYLGETKRKKKQDTKVELILL